MYSNSSYNFNQTPANIGGQSQFNQGPEMGTTFGYPMAPQSFPMQQQMGAQQMPQMQPQTMQMPMTGAAPVDFDMLPTTPVLDIEYTQGYLKTQIGKRVKVEFLIGTNMLVDREGTLVDVGISYIIINEVETDDLLLCDIYSIKFVRFYF
ncbi:MAG: hypothetical protein PHC45_08060 [Clostridiaceae bacterium]|nr:hypothetical protein [Clostridiaceae bacterium]